METESPPKEARRRSAGGTTKSNGISGTTIVNETSANRSPKAKRRKVNHACLYCRRSHMTCDLERPCTRCIKRNIGHLCHDEPREPVKRNKSEHGHTVGEDSMALKREDGPASGIVNALDQDQVDQQLLQESALTNTNAPGPESLQQAQQPPVSSATLNAALGSGVQPFSTYGNDWKLGGQNQFHDVHTFHPSYMFNAPEVTNEYNLLNDFLSTSLLDDGGMFPGDDSSAACVDSTAVNNMASGSARTGNLPPDQPQGLHLAPPANRAGSINRPASTAPADKEAQETYYLTAADPAGSDAPDARINKLLQAKYDAGMLRPFNYVKGYARLNKYMEKHMQATSRQKILRQLDKFRPKFRERMQSLTDIELVLVEMWFERCLMEYDRVFASMAVPACCWRRTGEIFRGNKEMAELIHVPIESLREGKLAIHDIIVESHLVSYWEKFGAIAFDNSQKAMLTTCSLKNPDKSSSDPEISCCFSFTIRRDEHNIPSLIVGNFLPMVGERH